MSNFDKGHRKDYASLLSEFPVHSTNEIPILDNATTPRPFDLNDYLKIIIRNQHHRQKRMTKNVKIDTYY